MKIVVATGNPHKVEEYAQLLPPSLELVALSDFPGMPDVPEDAPDFRGNAAQKARAAHEHTGLPCLADDSGIAVDALGGEPGVRSARWVSGSDRDRLNALLARMEGQAERGAQFVCAIALAGFPEGLTLPSGVERVDGCVVAQGVFRGALGHAPKGSGGFGYDPIFVLEDGRSVGEIPAEEKHRISHRALAVQALAQVWAQLA